MRFLMAIAGMALIAFIDPAVADSVVDGDTLYVGRLKYRLCGIDAPKRNDPGYRQAKRHLVARSAAASREP